MKIHRTKKGCLNVLANSQQRSAEADKSSENPGQDENHSAGYVHAENSDSALTQSLEERRRKLNLPKACDSQTWEELDAVIVQKLKNLLNKCTLDTKLETFGDIIYETCRERFGIKEPKPKPIPQKSRRQREMDNIRSKKRSLKKRMKNAPETEKAGLQKLWEELRTRHSALSRAESLRKRKRNKRKTQDRFFQDPYQFARKLFEQPKSGILTVDKDELEQHLRSTYSGREHNAPLTEIHSLIWPPNPEKEFNKKPPTLDEVQNVVRKGRTKSAPGPNGIPYLLYKKCPKVLQWLHELIRSAWKNQRIPQQWMTADGVYIPKEQNSTEINQFRPISLLNVEGKIFFSVMASRLSNYLLQNGFLDTSIQKGGVAGIPGCLEHASMIWEVIQKAKSQKKDLDVVWLDLANAYGSVPHQMIQQALRMYHVPENICQMLEKYFGGFRMRFSTTNFTTDWVNLDVGIAMGCTISPILFVLAMEVILKAASRNAETVDLGQEFSIPPLKAFMDDTTVLASDEEETHAILHNLDYLINWCRMSFKPKKSRSLSLRKGKVVENKTFRIGGQDIPTVSQEPVKSLGRWYDATLKDTKRGAETKMVAEEGLKTIDKSGLQGKHKLWCLQFMLIPKLLWPLMVYEITTSTVEAIEAKINKFTRKWLGVPPGLSDVALYCRQAKLKLPLKSIVEEYKTGKVRLQVMLTESQDEVVRSSQASLKTGRKWKVCEAIHQAEQGLKLKEVIGHTQTDRQGLGRSEMKWWSNTTGKEKRDMVIQEVRQEEDQKRIQKAVQQSQQGQWTTWEDALQRTLTWNDLWHMAPLRISFILRSVYDLLPSKANLVKWDKSDDPQCPLCSETQTTEHVLSACKVALAKGRYTWRHNKVLDALANILIAARGQVTTPKEIVPEFTTAGGAKKWVGKPVTRVNKKGLLDGSDDWEVSADLPSWQDHPEVIKQTRMKPDIVLYSESSRQMILVELTVPYESRIDGAHVYKTEKYSDLAKELIKKGHRAKVFAVEVGARGFVGRSVYELLSKVNISGRARTKAIRLLSEIAERSSYWIWTRRNENELHTI